MPFYPPFDKNIKYGDLVFGTVLARNRYAQNYLNFILLRACPDMSMSSFAVTMLEKKRLCDGANTIYSTDFIEFIQAHPKYREAMTMPYYTGKILSISSQEVLKENAFINDPTSINRKCKAGIEWGVRRKKINSLYKFIDSVRVHFILDGLDFQQLIQKSHAEDRLFKNLDEYMEFLTHNNGQGMTKMVSNDAVHKDKQIKHRTVTGSELRLIYRNRNDLAMQRKIQFWYEGKACCPPWYPEFDALCGKNVADLWKAYTPRSEKNLAANS